MAESIDERTLDPTPQRRQRAWQDGQVPRSPELSSAATLLGGLLVLLYLGGSVCEFLGRLLQRQLSDGGRLANDEAGIVGQCIELVPKLASELLPILSVVMLLAVVARVGQIGFRFQPARMLPDLDRINPLSGASRLVSWDSALRLAIGVIKIAVVASVAVGTLAGQAESLVGLAQQETPQIALFLSRTAMSVGLRIGFALLVIALADYLFQRWRHERSLRMTLQESREEARAIEGDPQLVQRQRNLQRQFSGGRAVAAAVATADVIIADSDAIAVALQYDPEKMTAPVVVTSGSGLTATYINQAARSHRVPRHESPHLARALFEQVPMNRPILPEHFGEVARLLK